MCWLDPPGAAAHSSTHHIAFAFKYRGWMFISQNRFSLNPVKPPVLDNFVWQKRPLHWFNFIHGRYKNEEAAEF